mgnify:CR=1 FL=1
MCIYTDCMNENMHQYYKALANPVRMRVFLEVAKHSEGYAPEEPQTNSCVSDICEAVGVPQPTVSNHLRTLEEAGLIRSIKMGKNCYNYVTKQSSEDLLEQAQFIYKQAHSNPY